MALVSFPLGFDALIYFRKIKLPCSNKQYAGTGKNPFLCFSSFVQQVWTCRFLSHPCANVSCSSGGSHVGVGGAPPPREAPAAEATAERPVLPAEAPAAEEAREGKGS